MMILDQLRRGDRQLRWLAVGILIGLGVLLAGLWRVQVVSAKRYEQELKTQQFRTVRVPAIRGRIEDRNGFALAENRPNYTLHLYLEELSPRFRREYADVVKPAFIAAQPGRKLVRSETEQLERYARFRVVSNLVGQISVLLGEPVPLDEKRFHRHYVAQRALPFVVMDQMSPGQVARYVEGAWDLPGVELGIQAVRTYPYGSTAAHLLGHLKREDQPADDDIDFYNYRLPDHRGELGIEGAFDAQLRGRPGLRSILVNNLNYRQAERDGVLPAPGKTVVLTLDLFLQRSAETALRSAAAQTRGAAIVMDVRRGDLLAVASSPGFDPNVFLTGIDAAAWEAMTDEKLRPMFNRASLGAYPPGSTFKVITALACLEAGLDPVETLSNPGYIRVGRRTIDDTAKPGDYDFRRAFIRSSNTYFIHHGLAAGLDRVLEMGHRFRLGQALGVLPRQETSGTFPTVEEVRGSWSAGNTANVCIGQEITVTPMQMAVVTSAVANGGRLFRPRLVERIQTAAGTEGAVETLPPAEVVAQVALNPQHLDLVRAAMFADVEDPEGTGGPARVAGMDVCGKTGTAQITQGRRVVDHITWFVSFAPYQNPRYAVVVMVESGGSGGSTCAPVARKIFQAIQQRERGGQLRMPALASNP